MFMLLGIGTFITLCKTLSLGGISITLLWTLISNLSNVAVPLPHGDFLVVILRCFVGKGMGPLIIMPALLAISFILLQISFKASISTLDSLILTLLITSLRKKYLKNFAI